MLGVFETVTLAVEALRNTLFKGVVCRQFVLFCALAMCLCEHTVCRMIISECEPEIITTRIRNFLHIRAGSRYEVEGTIIIIIIIILL